MTTEKIRPLVLEYTIVSGDFAGGGKAASEVKRCLSQLGCQSEVIRRVAIATYEAEMNMIIHSFGGKITIYISSENIKIVCEDTGPGISNIELAMKEGYSTASDKIREMGFGAGMGLPNMKNCSDNFRIDSGEGQGTKVEMVINI